VIVRKGNSLTLKLLAVFFVSGTLLFGALAVVVAALAPNFSVLATRSSLEGMAEDLTEALAVDRSGTLSARFDENVVAWGYDALYQNMGYRIVDALTQAVLLESSAQPSATMRTIAVDIPLGASALDEDGGMVLRTEADVGGRKVYVDVVRTDRISDLALEAVVPAALETLIMATSTGVVFILIYAFILVLIVRKEMLGLTRRVAGLGPKTQGQRIAVDELPQELQPLASAFNAALDRVDAGVERERRFVANAAHELRTPLAVIRARLEQPGQETLLTADLRKDTDYMTRVVSQLLDLAKVQSQGLSPPFGCDADPLEAARSMIAMLAPLAVGRRVDLSLDAPEPCLRCWPISQPALQIMVKNLIENAIAAAGSGGSVVVRLEPHTLSVSDNGPGVPEEARRRVFDRFWRGESRSRSGVGLGLSIVDEIARSAHARVEVDWDPELGGARFRVTFSERTGPIEIPH